MLYIQNLESFSVEKYCGQPKITKPTFERKTLKNYCVKFTLIIDLKRWIVHKSLKILFLTITIFYYVKSFNLQEKSNKNWKRLFSDHNISNLNKALIIEFRQNVYKADNIKEIFCIFYDTGILLPKKCPRNYKNYSINDEKVG